MDIFVNLDPACIIKIQLVTNTKTMKIKNQNTGTERSAPSATTKNRSRLQEENCSTFGTRPRAVCINGGWNPVRFEYRAVLVHLQEGIVARLFEKEKKMS